MSTKSTDIKLTNHEQNQFVKNYQHAMAFAASEETARSVLEDQACMFHVHALKDGTYALFFTGPIGDDIMLTCDLSQTALDKFKAGLQKRGLDFDNPNMLSLHYWLTHTKLFDYITMVMEHILTFRFSTGNSKEQAEKRCKLLKKLLRKDQTTKEMYENEEIAIHSYETGCGYCLRLGFQKDLLRSKQGFDIEFNQDITEKLTTQQIYMIRTYGYCPRMAKTIFQKNSRRSVCGINCDKITKKGTNHAINSDTNLVEIYQRKELTRRGDESKGRVLVRANWFGLTERSKIRDVVNMTDYYEYGFYWFTNLEKYDISKLLEMDCGDDESCYTMEWRAAPKIVPVVSNTALVDTYNESLLPSI